MKNIVVVWDIAQLLMVLYYGRFGKDYCPKFRINPS